MNRIPEKFEDLKANGRKAFIPFITAGDPDKDISVKIALELVNAGADILELGVPFSDPIADGPIIQASSMRSLAAGTSLRDVLEMAREIRMHSEIPIVLFSYFNPILNYGIERFGGDAAAAGVDGVLITDFVDEGAMKISDRLAMHGLDLISLIAPTTSEKRLLSVCSNAKGFIYAIARSGVTGVSESASSEAETLVRRARRFTERPIAVGFGISTQTQVEDVWRYSDGAVVGSAIVREIEHALPEGDPVAAVRRFVGSLLPAVAKDAVEI